MKKLICLIMLFIVTTTFAQDPNKYCKPLGESDARTSKLARMANASNGVTDNTTQYVYNVRFNVFNDVNNTNFCTRNGIPFGENDFLDIIKNLNINYNQYNIFFKYVGYNFYGGSDGNGDLTRIESSGPDNIYNRFDQMANILEKDAININFVDQIETPTQSPTATATYQSLKAQAAFGRPMIIFSLPSYVGIGNLGNGNPYDYTFDKSFIVTHEMGHTLGLFHTFQNFDSNNQLLRPKERVTREQFLTDGITPNPIFNATTAGDMIVDTPATRFDYSFNYNLTNCSLMFNSGSTYINTDDLGFLYDFPNIKYGNFMSYVYDTTGFPQFTPSTDCSTRLFTVGQGAAMRSYIENPPGIQANSGILSTSLQLSRNTIFSLFQPYARNRVIDTTIISTSDNGDGTAKVCRGFTETDFKFQPGFHYEFLDSESLDVLSSADNIMYPIIIQPAFNCPVRLILESNVSNLTELIGYSPTVCRGQECVTEPYIGGRDIMIKILGSMNYTIEQLNTIQVKDPELYDKLISEYYHILSKYTASGALTEKIIYKQ